MNRSLPTGIQGLLLIGLLLCVGCQSPHTPLDLNSFDPSLDQQFIADQYLRQVVLMKQKVEDLRVQAERYAQLFGPDSEWATSAKLLENFYAREVKNRERLAILHAELAKHHSRSTDFATR
ncbi:MAG: hypothetical protein AB7P17_14130 [Nitrospirales bacterium]|nr:hypothetical protein [Nitrospirales bacterium]